MIYRRKLLAERYHESLVNLPIQLPVISENIGHAYHLFVIRLVRRTELYDYLKKQQILCQIHYIPVHLHPYYQSLGFKKGQFPNAESFYETCLSIPLYPSMTDGQQDYVINKIKSYF
jgi:dTDP-4-amino-4,6-dideoxygalactose transaminase